MWRGGVGAAYLFTGPFVCRCLTSVTLVCFHILLIEPTPDRHHIQTKSAPLPFVIPSINRKVLSRANECEELR